MSSYAFWNNKGGVGKSFLCFISACEYAHQNPDTDVYVIDLCPQANLSETLLGNQKTRGKIMDKLISQHPRATIAGYLEARLSSPFKQLGDVSPFITIPRKTNPSIPANVSLICGDNLLEIISEAIRQTSQLSIPTDSWKQVVSWVKDLVAKLKEQSGFKDTAFFIDCNPSFAIYTQLALVAANYVVVPFTADDSSRRAVENVVALLYGIGDPDTSTYARISFSKRAKEEGLDSPVLHTFVSNRQTLYDGQPTKAFEAVNGIIKKTVDGVFAKHKSIFANRQDIPSKSFFEVPDYHSASIVASLTGTPLHRLQPGPQDLEGQRVQLNSGPLGTYKKALQNVVSHL